MTTHYKQGIKVNGAVESTSTITANTFVGDGSGLTNLPGGGGGSYNNANVDTHLNTSTATANQVLSWDGADYDWVASGSGTLAGLTDVDTTGVANDKILKYNSTTSKWEIADDSTAGGGTLGDLAVSGSTMTSTGTTVTIDDDLVVTGSVTSSQAGAPKLSSSTVLQLQAVGRVSILDVPISLHNFTTTQRDALSPSNGDIIYNNTSHGFEGFINGSWGSLGSSGGTGNISFSGDTISSSGALVEIDDPLTVNGEVNLGANNINAQFGNFSGDVTAGVGSSGSLIGDDVRLNVNGSVYFEGTQTNAFQIQLQAINPTADRIINLPDAAGTVLLDNNLNSSIDSHLNQSNPTSGYVLSWNGSDYAWTANGTGSGLGDVVDDTTPQLGGNLDVNGKNITFGDSASASDDRLVFGANTDMQIYHDSNDGYNYIKQTAQRLYFQNDDDGLHGPYIIFDHNTTSPTTIDFSTVLAFTSRDTSGGLQQTGQLTVSHPEVTANSLKGMMRFDVTGHVGSTGSQGILFLDGKEDEIRLGADINTNGATIQYKFTLGANGTSDFTFSDAGNVWFPTTENDPVLYLRRGEQYVFTNNSGGSHPFEIRVGNAGPAYNTGVTNNGASSGDIIFKVPMSAPATLYYQCTSHGSMGNTINIV